MKRSLVAIAVSLALASPANAGSQFFINIPSIVFGFGGGGGYDDYPPPPAYPPQYSPQAPIYGGNYYYKGDYPQPPPYAYPQYPGGVVIGGGYYQGYQGGYGYKKHRYRKRWVDDGQWTNEDPRVGGGASPPETYHPRPGVKPGCNQPPMCTGGRPWRPQ